MEILRIENLEFTYPKMDGENKIEGANVSVKVLDDISFSVNQGEFIVIMGESGCGKTTLLKMIKKELTPKGEKYGKVIYKDKELESLTDRESLEAIGYVMQNPDNQIITDKVYHELSFGLEALGYDADEMKRRIAEITCYFGIEDLYERDTDKLSGGQKQMINLSSVMVTAPRILLLDEPTSQLDPIAASEFLATIKKLNSEMGLTVIMVEHRLEEVFPIADKIILMEKGKILAMDKPSIVGKYLMKHKLINEAPVAVRVYNYMKEESTRECPISIKEGRNYLCDNYDLTVNEYSVNKECDSKQKDIITLKDVYFRYERNQKDVLKGMSVGVKEGEIFALLGGNGSGKTTTLLTIAGLRKNYAGKIYINGKEINKYKNRELYNKNITYLPQNPMHIFLEDTVMADYKSVVKEKDSKNIIQNVAVKLCITHLLHKHPYDLSGGELQKCAIGKLMLLETKIMLLDEPTKGLDGCSKEALIDILKDLQKQGITILLVSHDIEFVAYAADRCGLIFDGNVLSVAEPHVFMGNNSFYTASANRMCRDIIKGVITAEEIVSVLKKNAK